MSDDLAHVRDGVLTVPNGGEDHPLPVGGDGWYRWLDQPGTMAFRFAEGGRRFTARRERQRGHHYWYAYRRQGGKLHKRYLGRSGDLTPRRLAEIAARFDADSAPARTARTRPVPPEPRHNLPSAVSSFLGREAEIAAVRLLLGSSRQVTLTGPGGIGKTRLALQVAAVLLAEECDAVWLVALDTLTDPALIPQAIAQAAGVREEPGQPLLATLAAALGAGRVLLVLDNCEHLLESSADVTERLLRACPELRVLATSREPLRVAGEVTWRVPSLGLPARDEDLAPDEVARTEAVRLFVARAQAARPAFALTAGNVAAVAEICRRLDGIPLAIELAAAWVRMLSPEEISPRLLARLRLPGGDRIAAPRHRTLHATIDWSYDLLSPPERRCFERLSVFAGGCSLAAAEAVCAGDGLAPEDICDLLARLVDRSLVLTEEQPDTPETRFRLLETLQAYGSERLAARGESERLRDRHAAGLLARAESAARAFQGPEQGVWLHWAERERANARTALAWAVQREDTDTATRLAAAFAWPSLVHGHWSEGLEWAERALALPHPGPTRERAWLLVGAVQLAAFRGDLTSNRPSGDLLTVVRWVEECFAIGEALADGALMLAGTGTAQMLREFGVELDGVPVRTPEQEIAAARRIGDTWGERRALEALARHALRRGDHAAARSWLREAILSARQDRDAWSLALALNELGDVERAVGAHARAAPLYEESGAVFAALGLGAQPNLLHNLGYTALAAGDMAGASSHFTQALSLFRRSGERRGMAECLIGCGSLAAAERRPLDAARLFGAGMAALDALTLQLWPANRTDYERWLARAKTTRSTEGFDRALAEGRALSLPAAVAWALGGDPPETVAKPDHVADLPLTRRERDVARLAAQGLTNRQIGEALLIAEKTTANHLQRVLEKLDLRTRTQLAARAGTLGLDRS